MAVIGLDITRRTTLADEKEFGTVGAYELLSGVLRFAVDPENPRNADIVDLKLAQRGADGKVHFSTDFALMQPADPSRGNRRLLFDVVNRGRKTALASFNDAGPGAEPDGPNLGNAFLMRHGYTVAWCGWQHDVPSQPGLMGLQAPEALEDERPVRGRIAVEFQPISAARSVMLSDRGHKPYPAADLNDPDATLTVRDTIRGERRLVPRERWRFAREERGSIAPDPTFVYFTDGFEAGKIYEAIYATETAPVVGVGLLSARDAVTFLRYERAAAGNPCAGAIERAYSFGSSQSGAFLRSFLYHGLNEDEEERLVFDGVIAHIAGQVSRRFAHRFAQPSSTSEWAFGRGFPFSDIVQEEPVNGQRDGLLARLEARGKAPKVFYTNSGVEYRRGGALIHTDPAGRRDVDFPDNVRGYFMAGTRHGSGTLPLTDLAADGSRSRYFLNSIDYTPLLRAVLVNLDAWASHGVEPPASRVPLLANGTLVPTESSAAVHATIPGVDLPSEWNRLMRLDFGPGAAEGRLDILPPRVVEDPYPALVSAVDSDGNDVAGIRLPDVSVPLATHTAWNLRHPDIGAPDLLILLAGATHPFPRTAAERQAAGDPRPSIEERYASKEDYLQRVIEAAAQLVMDRYLLEEDVERILERASLQWDIFTAAGTPTPAVAEGVSGSA